MKKSLLLVDLSGLFRMHWHATQDMELGEAYNRTIGAVQRIVSHYDHVAICIDCPPYKRKEIFPDYKGQREAPAAQMIEQFTRIKTRLVDDGHLLWGVQGYEADDIIATAVEHSGGMNTMIASSDKDLLQLVIDSVDEEGAVGWVRCMSFATGQVFDEKAVIEKFGVPPAMMGDLLALMGDKSDNIAGIAGVGPKTAAELLKQFGTFEDMFSFADQIKQPKLRENVIKGAEAVKLARQLVKLETTAPIKFSDLFERREPKPLATGTGFDEADFEDAPKSDPETSKLPSDPPPPAAKEPTGPSVASAAPRVQSTALALRPEPPKEWALQLEPDTTAAAWTMATKLHNSRLFVQFGTAEAIFAVMLRGRSLGIDAVTSLANFHLIEGRPTMHAALIVGLVLKSGKADHFELVKTTDEEAIWATRRKGSTREVELSWSVKDALNAGLLVGTPDNAVGVSKSGKPSTWDKYRRTMLRWRAAVELARAVYPDITTGLYTPDEIADGVYDPAIDAKFEAA